MILENIRRCHLAGQVVLPRQDAAAALRQFLRQGISFALVFADPPYDQLETELARLGGSLARVISPGGLLVLEHDAALDPPRLAGLSLQRSCQYSATMLSFYL